MNKKSIFYTIAAIALTTAIFVTYGFFSKQGPNEKMDTIETRIDTVNFFLKDVENDMEKGVYIASFRTFLGFTQFVASNGTYINNLGVKFKESFLNGTLNKNQIDVMKGSTFTDWSNKISQQAAKIDINFSLIINGVYINQTDPWSIDTSINLTVKVTDMKNTSSWAREEMVSSKISIIGFEDPTYIVNTYGLVTNSIQVSNITQFVISGNASNLLSQWG